MHGPERYQIGSHDEAAHDLFVILSMEVISGRGTNRWRGKEPFVGMWYHERYDGVTEKEVGSMHNSNAMSMRMIIHPTS